MIKEVLRRSLPPRLLIHVQAADHYLNGEHELRLLNHLCDPARTSIDIGANIGIYTYFMRKHSRAVVSYEPNPGLALRLKTLFPDITIRQAAVSDRPGELRLRMPLVKGRPQHELASVVDTFDGSAEVEEHVVPSVQIDEENHESVGFIKVDAEQHEIQVLRGSLKTIEACRPVIMSEVTPLLYPQPLPEMFSFLVRLGYAGWFRFENAYLPFSQFRQETHANKALWGTRFMGNNVIFLPHDRDSSFLSRGSL